jgi:hypothetical protein
VADGVNGVVDQFGEQVADLLDGQRDQRPVTAAGPVAFPGCDHGEHGMGEHDERRVAVPGVPPADLMLIEADGALGRLEAGLDTPAGTGHPNQSGQAERCR